MIKQFLHKLRYSKGHGGILARGAIGVFIVKVAGVGLLFALHVMLARLLGAEQYGIYVYVWTWVNILAILCLLGFQISLVRFIAEYNIKQQWGLLRGILRKSKQFVLGFSILVSAVGTAVIWFLGDKISNEFVITFYIAFCVLPVFVFARLREASLRALKHAVQSVLLLQIVRPILMGMGLIAFLLLAENSLTARYAMISNFTAVIAALLIGTLLLHRFLPESVGQTSPEFANKQWLNVSLPLLLIAGMSILLRRTDIVMLGALKGSEQAGIYSAASKVSNLVVFALVAFNAILTPIVSELYYTKQGKKLQKIITLSARSVFTVTLGISIVLFFSGKFLLNLFGQDFAIAYTSLFVLLMGNIVCSLAGPVSLLMTMTGYQKLAGKLILFSVIINVILNFFLIPSMGLLGAAISTALALSFKNIIMAVYVCKKMKLQPTVLGF